MRLPSSLRVGPRSIRSMAVLSGFIALGLGACSSDSNGGGGGGAGTSSFVGTVVGGADNDESGSLTFDIAGTALAPPASITTNSSATLTVTGTLTLVSPAAGTVPLTGTYDDATNALDLSGGGYAFTGVFDGTSRLQGTYNGANGPGLFVTALDLGNAVAFCGTFDGDDDGTWNFRGERNHAVRKRPDLLRGCRSSGRDSGRHRRYHRQPGQSHRAAVGYRDHRRYQRDRNLGYRSWSERNLGRQRLLNF